MDVTTCSIYGPIITILLLTSIVSSYTFCSWIPQRYDLYPDAQLSFQCTDPSTPIMIIENAVIGYVYNSMNGSCTTFIGCSQQVPDFAKYCTGYNTPCSLNQLYFFTPYASQTCHTTDGSVFYLNYVSVNYSCIAANVQSPLDICNSQQVVYSSGLTYLSTSSSFPLSPTFPSSQIQCSCSFKPAYQAVTSNISIRALIVDLENYTSCSQKLTIRSCPNNDTVFCSRSISSNLIKYVQLGSNPSILFQSNSTDGHFLLEIRTLTSISGTIGSITCSSIYVVPSCDTSSVTNALTSTSSRTTLGQQTTSPQPLSTNVDANSTISKIFSSNAITIDSNAPVVAQTTPAAASNRETNISGISSGAIGGIVAGLVVLAIIIIILIIGCLRKKSENTSENIEDQKNKGTPLNGRGTPYLEPADVMKSSSDASQIYQGLNPSTLEACENNAPRNDEYQSLERPNDTRLDQLDDNKPNCPREASYLEPVMEPSPYYENGVSQNYQTLNFKEMEAHKHEPCDKVYQKLHPSLG